MTEQLDDGELNELLLQTGAVSRESLDQAQHTSPPEEEARRKASLVQRILDLDPASFDKVRAALRSGGHALLRCVDCGSWVAFEQAPDLPVSPCPSCGSKSIRDPASATQTAISATPPTIVGEALAPGTEVGPYRIIEQIGQGGMAIVYKAKDVRLDRTVALKHIKGWPGVEGSEDFSDPTRVERFLREARAIASLKHPHIVRVHDVGQAGNLYYLTMEYIEGLSLEKRLKREREAASAGSLAEPSRLRQQLELLEKVARAVGHAHQNGIIHRDLKPANILLDRQDEPYVSDFGLARRFDPSANADSEQKRRLCTLTRNGQIVGTPAYMPPEQIRGEAARIAPASDVYALGGILYEMLAGVPPFPGETMADVLLMALSEFPRSPRSLNSRLPRELEWIALKCLEKEPGRRYADGGELAEDLARWLKGRPVLASAPSRLYRARKFIGRNKGFSAALLLLLVVTLIALIRPGWRWLQSSSLLAEAQDRAEEARARSLTAEEEAEWRAIRELFHESKMQWWTQEAQKGYEEAVEALRDLAALRLEEMARQRTAETYLLLTRAGVDDLVQEAWDRRWGSPGCGELTEAWIEQALEQVESAVNAAMGPKARIPPLAYAYRGWLLLAVGREGEGLKELQQAAVEAPEVPYAHLFRARGLLEEYAGLRPIPLSPGQEQETESSQARSVRQQAVEALRGGLAADRAAFEEDLVFMREYTLVLLSLFSDGAAGDRGANLREAERMTLNLLARREEVYPSGGLNSEELLLLLAQVLCERGDWEEALSALGKVLGRWRRRGSALHLKALCHLLAARSKPAVGVDPALDLDRGLEAAGEWAAMERVESALLLQAELHRERAGWLEAREKKAAAREAREEARALYEEVLEENPTRPEALERLEEYE